MHVKRRRFSLVAFGSLHCRTYGNSRVPFLSPTTNSCVRSFQNFPNYDGFRACQLNVAAEVVVPRVFLFTRIGLFNLFKQSAFDCSRINNPSKGTAILMPLKVFTSRATPSLSSQQTSLLANQCHDSSYVRWDFPTVTPSPNIQGSQDMHISADPSEHCDDFSCPSSSPGIGTGSRSDPTPAILPTHPERTYLEGQHHGSSR